MNRMRKSASTTTPLKAGNPDSRIVVNGVEVSWNTEDGTCRLRGIPAALLWVDSTLAGMMSGLAAMVGPERFHLALQAEGRRSVAFDWQLIESFPDFADGFARLSLNAKAAGWGEWRLAGYYPQKQECVFQVFNNWEGGYQKALGVCWGSGMLAGKLAGICSMLFRCNCWATQTRFVANGDAFDEFVVAPSERNLEKEIENLLYCDQATRADMAVALKHLEDIRKTLQESEERYAQLVRNIPDGVYTCHYRGEGQVSFTYVSPRFCEILGVQADAVLADYQQVFALVHPDDVEVLQQSYQDSRRVLAPFRWEGRFLVRGQTRWVGISSDPRPQADGSCVWHGVVRDVTELHEALESQRLAALVYSSSREAMLVVDADNRILSVNPALVRLTGYQAEELLGKSPKILGSDKHDAAFYRALLRELDGSGYWEGEVWERRKNGETYPAWLRINTIYGKDGQVSQRVVLFNDITEKKLSAETIWKQANFDALTGLPNRSMFRNLLEREIKRAERQRKKLALLFLDLDHFKDVNDTLGHQVGDELLKQAAERLQKCVRETDTVSRLGGDEFTVILTNLDEAADISRVAQCLTESMAQPFRPDRHPAYISVSIGVTVYPDDANEAETLVKQADQAMYAAKQQGRNRVCFFTSSLQKTAEQRVQLANDLRDALAGGQFEVYYQPIVELAGGRIPKAEALLRWRHPQQGFVSPAVFIPIAEETKLILDIGDWVFRQVAGQLLAWQALAGPDFQISVNKSPVQFRSGSYCHTGWIEVLESMGLQGRNLVVEVTEGILLDANRDIRERMLQLRGCGVQVAIDDFGTGYSALSYLNKFDIDYLKIDQSFTRNLAPDSSDLVLCEAIVVMAHKLGLRVIAEGVETEEQRDLLKAIGCDYGQGYLFSRPVPAQDFAALLRSAG